MQIIKNSVLVTAHPDDEAIGCFSTLLKHKKLGDKINIIFLTRLSAGANDQEKVKEKNCFKALKILSLNQKNIFF